MENIGLFALTVSVYYFVWFLVSNPQEYSRSVYWRIQVKRIALVALLALPLNIGGNVFTIAGNATAEKSVYSLFSVYQKAGQDAFTLTGLTYQQAGLDAVTFLGLTYQQAGHDAVTLFGLAGYQQAGHDAVTLFGLAGYQQAGLNAITGTGLVGYQKAEVKTMVPVAIALYQRVGEETRAFGAFSKLTKY